MENILNFKYFVKKPGINSFVSWKLVDKNEKIISDTKNYQCFAPIASGTIPAATEKIIIYRPVNLIPYSPEIIKNFISDLNEMGFPCGVEFIYGAAPTSPASSGAPIPINSVEFPIELKNYKYKIHLFSTLSLIRCLFESWICLIPDIYFRFLDLEELKNEPPGVSLNTKFEKLQEAHFEITKNAPKETKEKIQAVFSCYCVNSQHIVTFSCNSNKKPIPRDLLFKRFSMGEYGRDYGIFDAAPQTKSGGKRISLHEVWKK